MAGPPPPNGVNPQEESEQLRMLVSLLHAPQGTDVERQAEALDVESIVRPLPPQPPPQYGELPGVGYLYADAPGVRQAAMVHTTPEIVRTALLRAIETVAMSVLPFGEHPPDELAKAALAFSQAYLLLDPSVDEEGIPVALKAQLAEQQQRAGAEASAQGQAHVAQATAETQGAKFQHPVTAAGHPEPPRVNMNPAEQAVAEKNKPKSEVLRGARGDRPRPQPRVGQ